MTQSNIKASQYIKDTVERKSCSNAPISGCKICHKKGIPIFPVRYTVCMIEGHEEIPILPDDLIKSLTTIRLDQALSDEGNLLNTQPLSRYILKKLRKGYLYIYDEIYNGQWQCMGIMPGGELLPFPPAHPIPPEEISAFTCKNTDTTTEHLASLLTIPVSNTSRKIYIAFTEYPWSIEQIDHMKKNKGLISKYMQEFIIDKTDEECIHKNNGLIKSPDNIVKYLPEYNSYVSSLASQDLIYSPEGLNNIYEDELNKAFIKTSLSPKNHKGLMLIVNDEIAIIKQLKEYRHLIQNNLEKSILERGGEQGVREYYWLKTVQLLEESLKKQFNNNMLNVENKIKKEYSEEEYSLYEKDSKEYTKMVINSTSSNIPSSLFHDSSNEIRNLYREIRNIKSLKQQTINEFNRYYSLEQRKNLEKNFNPIIEDIIKKNTQLDADYCKWVRFGLLPALDRHDQENLEHSMYAVSIIASILDDGSILSNNSRWLWSWLHENSQKDCNSILNRGILLNHKNSRKAYGEILEQDSEEANKLDKAPIPPLNTLKLKQWYDIIKKGQKLSEKYKDITNKELSWKAGWSDFRKPYDQLRNASATSRTALWQKNYSEALSWIITGRKMEGELTHSIRQLQISGMVEAALSNQPPDDYMLKATKYNVQSQILYSIIEINYEHITNTTPGVLNNIYSHGSFKTGNTEYTHNAGGNFIIKNAYSPNQIKIWAAHINDYSEKVEDNLLARFIANELSSNEILKYEKVILDEQKKVAESWSNGKKFVISANMLMAGYSLITTFEDLKKHPENMEKWWKATGSFIGFTQSVCDYFSNSLASSSESTGGLSYRVVKALTPLNRTQIAKLAILSKAGGNLLSKTLAVIGIVDGIISMIKSYEKYLHGGTSLDLYVGVALGGLSIIGGIVTIALGAAVLIPVTLTLIILTIGGIFFLTHLIPENIENWLRRSIYGKYQKNVMGGVFNNIEEEQSSLQMVLRGITANIFLENKKVYYATTAPSLHVQDDNYILSIVLSFSDTTPTSLKIETRDPKTNTLLFSLKSIDQSLHLEATHYGNNKEYFPNITVAHKEKNQLKIIEIECSLGEHSSNEYKVSVEIDNDLAKDTYYVKKI